MVKIRRLEFLEKQKHNESKTGSQLAMSSLQEEMDAAAKARKEAKVNLILIHIISTNCNDHIRKKLRRKRKRKHLCTQSDFLRTMLLIIMNAVNCKHGGL